MEIIKTGGQLGETEGMMEAQYYPDGEYVVRVFDRDNIAIMDCLMCENSITEADAALKRCRLKRRIKWQKVSDNWYLAKVRWRE